MDGSTMRRLAVFHPAFELVGGAENLAAAHALFYRSRGVTADIVTFAHDAECCPLAPTHVRVVARRHWTDLARMHDPMAKLRGQGRRVTRVLADYDVVVAHGFPASALLGEAPVSARKVWLCSEPPRHIHMREANPVMTARLHTLARNHPAAAVTRFRAALSAYDRRMNEDSAARARKDYDLAAVEQMDEIHAVSEFSRENARRIYGRCAERVVYPLVEFPERVPARQGLDRSVRRVLTYSRLETQKNIDTVVRGFGHFAAASPVPCELHVVGLGGARTELETLAAETCPPGSVYFHGYLTVAALRALFERCAVFALLPIDEPFGLVYPEAAAGGLLLVGPDHGGPREILDDGRLGFTVDAFSAEALADALARVWALDDATVDRRRERAAAACRSRFGVAALGTLLMELLDAD
jgi:glycosyltransferase involved in cell wall biosynthesis